MSMVRNPKPDSIEHWEDAQVWSGQEAKANVFHLEPDDLNDIRQAIDAPRVRVSSIQTLKKRDFNFRHFGQRLESFPGKFLTGRDSYWFVAYPSTNGHGPM